MLYDETEETVPLLHYNIYCLLNKKLKANQMNVLKTWKHKPNIKQ